MADKERESFLDEVNLEFYERHFSDEKAIHKYPNVNTVRCEIWYFNKNSGPGKILDYGFGYGQEAIYFAEKGYKVYGLDISKNALSNLQTLIKEKHSQLDDKITLSLISASDDKLPYEDNFFDYIHSNQVIYHLPSKESILRLIQEWYRVLKPNGKVMFSTIGPENTLIEDAVEIKENLFEKEYKTPSMEEVIKIRNYLMKDEDSIKKICEPFKIDEIGWFSNHYCGVDGFHWQVLARK